MWPSTKAEISGTPEGDAFIADAHMRFKNGRVPAVEELLNRPFYCMEREARPGDYRSYEQEVLTLDPSRSGLLPTEPGLPPTRSVRVCPGFREQAGAQASVRRTIKTREPCSSPSWTAVGFEWMRSRFTLAGGQVSPGSSIRN